MNVRRASIVSSFASMAAPTVLAFAADACAFTVLGSQDTHRGP